MLNIAIAQKTLRLRFDLELEETPLLQAFELASRLRNQFNGMALQREALRYDRDALTIAIEIRQTVVALCWDDLLFEQFAASKHINPREYQQRTYSHKKPNYD